jgi:hypothetical protein
MRELIQPSRRFVLALLAAALGLTVPAATRAETFVGSNVDSRVTLAF